MIARDDNVALEARGARAKKAGRIAGKVAGGIFKTALHFLREDEPELVAREFTDEDLYARDVDEQLYARDFDEALYARDFGEELYARKFDEELFARDLEARGARAKKAGRIAGKVAGGIFKTALHFLREDEPLLVRSIEEEPVLARALEDHVTEMVERSLENGGELSARDMEELETRNAKKAGRIIGKVAGGIFKTALKFLREDNPELYAREFEDGMLFERAMEIDELD